ncbi:DNA-protecting protein DprA [Virgibacillus phasianinus]|uniref:DNA-protecting protein DprA n=2 Tax=Virgibacillus phasianinus TaxID=2017483 RepID=A0A220U5C1_9BACI|nr:DNA-protecting protein DprA [Virgibacillus phasianinus]
MLSIDPALSSIYHLSSTQLSQTFSIPQKQSISLYQDIHNPKLLLEKKQDIAPYTILTVVDELYPTVLKTIKDPPLVLYALGDLSLLKQTPALSVIGTRLPSQNARNKMKLILPALLQEKWVIVSGMAMGIDSFAHQFALGNNGKTIAVLGGGFQHIYPKQNITLFDQITKKGLVLSEYPPNQSPAKHHFPERNRIISGLSFGTLVVEAKEKSGTLITVDQALDQGREVYAIPDSPTVPESIGCNRMIQDGAKLVIHPDDILDDWNAAKEIWINQLQDETL